MTVQQELQRLGNREKAALLSRYFKTGKGEYGEGDVFLGLTVPQQRVIAKKYRDLPLSDVEDLLHNNIHEYRLTALLILCAKYKKASAIEQKKIVDIYVRNTKHINNWDLVDLSSHVILGLYLIDKPRDMLYTFVRSSDVWRKRIAVITTFAFIRNNDFGDSFALAEILLNDSHDLIHKAVGWILREVGKRDLGAEEAFLQRHYRIMPRTMLRYAVEKFSPAKRAQYLSK